MIFNIFLYWSGTPSELFLSLVVLAKTHHVARFREWFQQAVTIQKRPRFDALEGRFHRLGQFQVTRRLGDAGRAELRVSRDAHPLV